MGIFSHTFIPHVTSNTGYRTLTGVKNAQVGHLGKFEESAVSYEKDGITQFLDDLWVSFVKPFRDAFNRSNVNSPRERLEDEKRVQKNFSGTTRNAIKLSTGEQADVHMNMDGTPYDGTGSGVTINLKTEHGNVYAYDFREPNIPYLFAENTSVSQLRDIINGNNKPNHHSPKKQSLW